MNTFKVGDWVECVDTQGRSDLKLGRIYRVTEVIQQFNNIRADDGIRSENLLSSRFKLADNYLFNQLVDEYYEANRSI